MDGAWWAAAAAVIVALVGAYGQWRIARRQASGTVDSSDARTLFEQTQRNFEQADAIRKELRTDVDRQAIEIERLNVEVGYLRAENATVKQEMAAQAHRLDAAEEHVRLCEEKLARLRRLPLTVLTEQEGEEGSDA